ncbi:bifunctional diaminohydroxyphosphoribosylaminopyrimidine deaminase/5-amino-6-(5-phosphoribosylamino)uracil reductase RibD [Alteromonas lipolytica]|uniref:Riboflavin biosynthesis protein RibD n=1 Tax=Alteromonas lipolytica TaxID=1856405 RepID=A0A1E8F9A4_9ALTE|nr:bifunctional diaminohydroxyphosphoribosylaminopyrimidine deaminase/5-amino-6-(5-phosphoribosylamino)uracil reductase RibD [Alteromonas lipolytica]OFI32501.1 riboflavin biosynthesis protein RibD [Alteromonas lipolytica]GGF75675.1 riboflavin biosynthesis protein RibD [Alteromonas lipolytica]
MQHRKTSPATDEFWMAKAIRLAAKGCYTTSPNPRVGCVIVKNDECIGQGYHIQAGTPHAEVHALVAAGDHARDATAYVTLEPCSHTGRTPPCADALIKAGVKRVVVGMTDPNPQVSGQGIERIKAAGIAVTQDVLTEQAKALNPGFIKRMESGLPWVRVKLGISLDGKIALQNGASKWITGPAARRDVQRLRAKSCAIITGSGTVIADNPSMLVRPEQAEFSDYPVSTVRQPLRVVIDSQEKLTPNWLMFNDGQPVLLVNQHFRAGFSQDTQQCHLPLSAQGKIDLSLLLAELAGRGINEVLVESGAGLAGAFLANGLVDELIVYQAPVILGDKGVSMLNLPVYDEVNQAPHLKLTDIRHIAQDIRLTYQIVSDKL